jgi:tetratricopeptide (TPR) repeat protein
MRLASARSRGVAAAIALALIATPALGQYREYYVRGRVLDSQKEPIPHVKIRLVDPSTSRAFDLETDEKGEFKFAGLPHAAYQVTYSCEGYVTATDEWDLDARQDRMKKVEIPDVVLASEARVKEAQRLGAAKAAVEEAGDKIRAGDLDAAIAVLQKVLQESPDDPNALYYLGLSYAGKKMHAEAVDPLTRVTELSPDFPGAWFQLGVSLQALGEPEKALAAYDRTLELDPANAGSAYNSGLLLFEQNEVAEALARFEKGLASEPDDPELNEMAGRCYLHEAELERALEHLEKARGATTDPDKVAFLDELISQVKALAP